MGHREVRQVPLDWQHPVTGDTDRRGRPVYIPLLSRRSLLPDLNDYAEHPGDWGSPPDPCRYMPEIPEGTPLGFQLYETTSEGTPVSPVFGTLEALAAWCEDGATVVASHRWSRQQWLAAFRGGSTGVESLLIADSAGIRPLGPRDA